MVRLDGDTNRHHGGLGSISEVIGFPEERAYAGGEFTPDRVFYGDGWVVLGAFGIL
jgi:hypothetical protein